MHWRPTKHHLIPDWMQLISNVVVVINFYHRGKRLPMEDMSVPIIRYPLIRLLWSYVKDLLLLLRVPILCTLSLSGNLSRTSMMIRVIRICDN